MHPTVPWDSRTEADHDGYAVTLTLNEITPGVTVLHQRAENELARDGKLLGTIGLIMPDARIGAVLPFGPGGQPPSDAFVREHAAARGAVGLVLTGMYSINPEPLTRRQANLDPRDLPLPSGLDPSQRGEQILSTAVLHGHDLVLRVSTPIARTAFGTSLGERSIVADSPAMTTGEARHLLALLETIAHQ